MCGFLENNKCLRLGTPAIVTLFLLQTNPGPHQRREKLCGPHRKKFGDPCFRVNSIYHISGFRVVRVVRVGSSVLGGHVPQRAHVTPPALRFVTGSYLT